MQVPLSLCLVLLRLCLLKHNPPLLQNIYLPVNYLNNVREGTLKLDFPLSINVLRTVEDFIDSHRVLWEQ
jgi:hypothetical protein